MIDVWRVRYLHLLPLTAPELSDWPIAPDAATPAETTKPSLPIRMKKGVGPKALGAMIPAHFIIYPGHARVIGQVEMESTDKVTFEPAEKALTTGDYRAPRQRIVDWIMPDQFTTPCMIGVVVNARPKH